VTQPDVVSLVRPPSILIYLKARPSTALARLGADRATRPLLMRPDPLGELTRLLKDRRDAYAAADHVIDTELVSLQRVIDAVAEVAASVR
jgi:shikimate kinase